MMNNSIEIKSSTLLIAVVAIVLFSITLFMLDRYDKTLKKDRIESCITNLEKSRLPEEITTLMESAEIESTDKDTVEANIVSEIRTKMGLFNKECECVYANNSELIVTGEFGYKTLGYNTRNSYNEKKMNFVTSESISKKTETLIENMEKQNANVVNENVILNSESRSKRIIIPLKITQSGSIYLKLSYKGNSINQY